MATKRSALICTVGTSLLTNINAKEHRADSGVSAEEKLAMQALLEAKQIPQLAKRLAGLDPKSSICGAEINSIEDSFAKLGSSVEHLHFLVSETEDGKKVGELLKAYYFERADKLGLKTVEYHIIEKLQDADPKLFKTQGLRNLVRISGEIISKRGVNNVAFNATGGYKAQIAIAVVLGQALELPVLYRHERFYEIIDFPPMPITFDYKLLGENASIFASSQKMDFTSEEVESLDERVRVLFDEVEVDGEILYGLSAIGQIYIEGFRQRSIKRGIKLESVPLTEKKDPSFRDDHYPDGFKAFVAKICQEVAWVKTAHSLPYHKQKSIKGIAFDVREGKLIGTYQDKDKFGARFELLITAQTLEELAWAAYQLNELYSDI